MEECYSDYYKLLPYKVNCPICHGFDTLRNHVEASQSHVPPYYFYPGKRDVVCNKCLAVFDCVEIDTNIVNTEEKENRPIATLVNYRLAERPIPEILWD